MLYDLSIVSLFVGYVKIIDISFAYPKTKEIFLLFSNFFLEHVEKWTQPIICYYGMPSIQRTSWTKNNPRMKFNECDKYIVSVDDLFRLNSQVWLNGR